MDDFTLAEKVLSTCVNHAGRCDSKHCLLSNIDQ